MKQLYLFFLAIIVCLNSATAYIIRDSEIEEAVNMIVEPLREHSGLGNLKIYIINDSAPNSFIISPTEICITSGLIINFPDPDVLRAIIAHEIGHILKNHGIRRSEAPDDYRTLFISRAPLGIESSIGKNIAQGVDIPIGSEYFPERSINAYPGYMEAEANLAALELIEKSSHSAAGFIKFFDQTQSQSAGNSFSQYDQIHPLNDMRINEVRDCVKKSKLNHSKNDPEVNKKYMRSAAKLAAFTLDEDRIFDCSDEEAKEINQYIKAIRYLKSGDLDNSVNHINFLLMKHPSDAYYHELKAQIYLRAGKNAALHEYEAAGSVKADDALIRLGRAIVAITLSENDLRISKYYKDLMFVLDKEPDNLLALHYLSVFYERNGLEGKSNLNKAIIALKSGRPDAARELAKVARRDLKQNSPEWCRAGDILESVK